MIGDVLEFLRSSANAHLAATSEGSPTEERVVLVDGERLDPFEVQPGVLSLLLVNMEEERILRRPNPFQAIDERNGEVMTVAPEVRLQLFALFVARFRDYAQGLNQLSGVVHHFQRNRRIDRSIAPDLPEGVEELFVELITLPLLEQNELWTSMRTAYHPSLLYRVGILVFHDELGRATAPTRERVMRTTRIESE